LAAVLATPEGKALIEKGHQFSIEELQAAFAQVLEEAEGDHRVVIEAAFNALMVAGQTEGVRLRRVSVDGKTAKI
jgi:hypothetical protein